MATPPVLKDPLRHHNAHKSLHGAFGGDKFGVQAERFARFFGTPKFILMQSSIVVLWIVLNGVLLAHELHTKAFDPYPFILLNLLFSTQSAYAAPLILLAQTRQADRDKAAEEADAQHREEIAATQLANLDRNTELTTKIHTLQVQQMEILDLLKGQADG